MIVVDASIIATTLLDDAEDGAFLRERLRSCRLAAPDVIDLEVLSVIRRLHRAGRVTAIRASQAVDDLSDLRIERAPHRLLLRRCWELRSNLTPYDAAYLALAEALGAPLLTADARLASAPGITCPVEVLSPTSR